MPTATDLRCARPLRGTDTPATGTDAGWQRHYRANEPACDECLEAHRAHVGKNQKSNPVSHREANRRWREAHPEYFSAWRAQHPEYGSWQGMVRRCTVPTHIGYERWGGRGITVCKRWLNSFEDFVTDMGPKPTAQHSIDRIDNDGNYEPGNCRWATDAEQRANRG